MLKHSKLCIAMTVFATTLATGALAQEVELEEGVWARGINLGFNLTDGNSDTVALTLGADAAKKWDQNEFFSRADYRYGETASLTTTENAEAIGQYNRLFTELDYGYLNSTFRWDSIAQIDYRFFIGPGYGRYLVKNEATTLGLEIGASWFAEDVSNVTDDGFVLRVGQRWTQALSETAQLVQYLEYLPKFDDFNDYLINAGIAAEAAVNSTISLRIAIDDRYDKTPGPGLKDNDIFVSAGVVYRQ